MDLIMEGPWAMAGMVVLAGPDDNQNIGGGEWVATDACGAAGRDAKNKARGTNAAGS
jgi:hypothetical protein